MNTTHPIRVMIVDDHAMVRTGIRAFLRSNKDLELVGEAGSGQEAAKLCQTAKPDVVLMDIRMPGVDGIEATRRIVEVSPQTKVITLTNTLDPERMAQALEAGATGFLSKSVSAEELAGAIRAAHAGHTPLSPQAADMMLQLVRNQSKPGDKLTERELEVLTLISEGLSNAQIGERLFISLPTVKFHVGSILDKLGAANRAEAVTIAWQNQLLKPG